MGVGHLPGPLRPAVTHAHPGRRHPHHRPRPHDQGADGRAGRGRSSLRPAAGHRQPYALTIRAAAIQSDAELGGLPLSRLAIRQKAGRNHLTFGQANPQSVELLQPSAEAATVEAGNLANANAAAISLKGDAASYRLDFGGALQCRTRVAISTRASSVEITMPASPQPGSPQHRCCPTSTSATASTGRRVPTGPQPRPLLIGRS
jgi:hypothetical protein